MTEGLIDRLVEALLALVILGGLAFRLRRGLKMLLGKPKSNLDQLSDESDNMQRLNDKNREI